VTVFIRIAKDQKPTQTRDDDDDEIGKRMVAVKLFCCSAVVVVVVAVVGAVTQKPRQVRWMNEENLCKE
jgi:hypothetical protein